MPNLIRSGINKLPTLPVAPVTSTLLESDMRKTSLFVCFSFYDAAYLIEDSKDVHSSIAYASDLYQHLNIEAASSEKGIARKFFLESLVFWIS